jgi:hypothetical protein
MPVEPACVVHICFIFFHLFPAKAEKKAPKKKAITE